MNRCTNSFPRPDTLVRVSLLIAVIALPAVEASAQAPADASAFQKASLKTIKPCTITADGEVTALIKNGVELSVTEDLDCDGVPDAYDNCVGIPNRDQADANHNGIGDACESATNIKAPPIRKIRAINNTVTITKTAKDRPDKKTKDRKAIAADKHSRPSTNKRRRH